MDYVKKKFIQGSNEIYSITEDGRIFSHVHNEFKEPTLFKGYERVGLFLYGKPCNRFIHILVYEHFVGPIPVGAKVKHKDGNKLNNSVDNLYLKVPKALTEKQWEKIEERKQKRKDDYWRAKYAEYGLDYDKCKNQN